MRARTIWRAAYHPRDLPKKVKRRLERQPVDPRDICGKRNPVVPKKGLDWVDYSVHETSPGQQAIEEALGKYPEILGYSVLHVGVGNSSFAKRFAPTIAYVEGITVAEPEVKVAQALGISNYRVRLRNKYTAQDLGVFDLIIDNNLTSFACCTYHFYRMMDNYVAMLNPGGSIITEQEGLGWRCDWNEGWKLNYEQLAAIAERFELVPSKLTNTVYRLLA